MLKRYSVKLSGILILVGLIGIFESFRVYQEDKAFLTHGLTALAEPDGTPTKGQSYQGSLIFRTKTGEWITIPATKVPITIRDSFRVVKNVQIKYLPENPSMVRFSDSWGWSASKIFVHSVLCFVVGFIAFRIFRKSHQ